MSRSTPRRGGAFSPLFIVVVIAVVLWMFLSRPQSAPETGAPPSATEISTAESNTVEGSATALAPEADAPAPPAATSETAVVDAPGSALPAADAPAALSTPTKASTHTPKPATPTAAPTRGPPATIDGLPVITVGELPRQALDTLALIERGGPFPFDRDGITFQNRERLLPRQPAGYYREYTVITPGASTRGARRIVAGEAGELYYTDDHYASFSRIWTP